MNPSRSSRARARARRAAFTLIELLAVIAIIGILAAILIPTVSAVRATARASVCASNLRQIGTGLVLYAGEHRGELPPGLVWDREINTYMGGKSLTVFNPAFTCVNDLRDPNSRPRSYVASGIHNGFGANEGVGVFSGNTTTPSRNLTRFAFAPRTILITELFTDGWQVATQFDTSYAIIDGWLGGTGPLLDGSPYHRTGLNYVFADGHVERLTMEQVTTGIGGQSGGRWRAY